MVFVDEARVDSQLSMGYKDGGLYCVAPVMDEVTASEVGFWAVGQDCCSARGNFVCDDAWNTDARAAIVVRQDDSLFGAGIFERYMKAVRQAEAAYEITASAHPVFVRWVLNPSEVQANYQREGYGLLAVMWAIYLVVSIIVTFFINTKKKNFQMAGRDDRGSRKTLGTEADAESGRPGNTLVPSDSRRSHGTTMRYS